MMNGMSALRNLKGQSFSRLSVVKRAKNDKYGKTMWLCRCICGEQITVRGYSLLSGNTQSCGCLKSEAVRAAKTTHGYSCSSTYSVWQGMLDRVRNEKNNHYASYGGRGISLCKRWESFENFLGDMGLKPEGHSIERIDVNGDYCPENCEWIPMEKQARNRRDTIYLTYQGKTQCLADWADEFGLTVKQLDNRIRRGWQLHRAFTTPVGLGNEARRVPTCTA